MKIAIVIGLIAAFSVNANAQQATNKFKFKIDFEAQRDGQQAISNTYNLNSGSSSIILPPSIWKCFVRPTVVNFDPVIGRNELKELVCAVIDGDNKQYVQTGISVLCADKLPNNTRLFYVRERDMIFRFTFSCSQ